MTSSLVKPVTPDLFPTGIPEIAQHKSISRTRDGQCTHITMTRVYTEDIRCAICLQPGSMGWLYRCTQDRELLIEDDLENNIEAPFDKLTTMFPLPSSRKKRSPAARTSSSLAFLDEINHDTFKTYTPVQISSILKQRNQLLEVLKEKGSDLMMLAEEGLRLSAPSEIHPGRFSIFSVSPEELESPQKKSWLPTKECQFKCCQLCRPSFRERSYLSLDAVVNGELPATAVTGFGFHYRQERPVALVEHVRNLGLRPNPAPQKKLYQGRPPRISSLLTTLPSAQSASTGASNTLPSPFNDEISADSTFGQVSNAYDSTAMTRSLNIESGPFPHHTGSLFGASVRKAFDEMMLLHRQGVDIKGVNKFAIRKDPHKTVVRPPWTPPNSPYFQKDKTSPEGNISENIAPGSSGRSTQSLKTDHGLRSRFNLDEFHEDGDVGLFLPLDDALLNRACATALPAEISDELLERHYCCPHNP